MSRPPDTGTTRSVTLRFRATGSEARELRARAKALRTTVSDMVRRALGMAVLERDSAD